MNTAELIDDAALPNDEMLQVQLLIARRADQLARSRATQSDGNTDLNCWLEAEREVLGRAEPDFARV